MTLDSLTGRTYGPSSLRVCSEKVSEYVDATGDDAQRWTDFAPPSFAAVVLFAAAPLFLADPEVRPHAEVLIHADQSFRWAAPFAIEERLEVRGAVERVRRRGETSFATFRMIGEDPRRATVLESTSTFLMRPSVLSATGPNK